MPVLYPYYTGLASALFLEAGWEILENSPLIINRYRQVTIALGYNGDSILNSLSDIVMMSIGFLAATHLSPWMSIAALIAMKFRCAWRVRERGQAYTWCDNIEFQDCLGTGWMGTAV